MQLKNVRFVIKFERFFNIPKKFAFRFKVNLKNNINLFNLAIIVLY
jgi:hypothetical protein